MLFFTRNPKKLNHQGHSVLVQEFPMAMKTLKKPDNQRIPYLIKRLQKRNLKELNKQRMSCQKRAKQVLVKGLLMKNLSKNLTKLNNQSNPALVQEFPMAMKTLKKLDNLRIPILIKGL